MVFFMPESALERKISTPSPTASGRGDNADGSLTLAQHRAWFLGINSAAEDFFAGKFFFQWREMIISAEQKWSLFLAPGGGPFL